MKYAFKLLQHPVVLAEPDVLLPVPHALDLGVYQYLGRHILLKDSRDARELHRVQVEILGLSSVTIVGHRYLMRYLNWRELLLSEERGPRCVNEGWEPSRLSLLWAWNIAVCEEVQLQVSWSGLTNLGLHGVGIRQLLNGRSRGENGRAILDAAHCGGVEFIRVPLFEQWGFEAAKHLVLLAVLPLGLSLVGINGRKLDAAEIPIQDLLLRAFLL